MRKQKLRKVLGGLVPPNKKAVSLIVSYVLLISIVLALSSLVYAWIKPRVEKPFAEESCPDDLSLILVSYECSGGTMNITVQNKGLFNIGGFIIKSSDEPTGMPGKSSFDLWLEEGSEGDNFVEFPGPLRGNEKNSTLFAYDELKPPKQIEIEPFIKKEGKKVYCEKSIITSKTNCD